LTQEVVIDAPYEVIYHNAEKLEEYADDKEEAIKTDITLLLKEVEQVQASKRKDAETLAQTGHVTYELLWTVLYVGRMVCQKHMNEEQVSIIAPAYSSPTAENHPLVLWSLDYDGTNFTYTEKKVSIKTFKGSKAITDLEVYPLDNWKSQDRTIRKIKDPGRSLSGQPGQLGKSKSCQEASTILAPQQNADVHAQYYM